jgi:hypothetical protein
LQGTHTRLYSQRQGEILWTGKQVRDRTIAQGGKA